MNLSANRVVLILHGVLSALTIAGLYVAAITHSLPQKWQATVGVAGGMLGALALGTSAAIKFLDGSQKSEALQAQSGILLPSVQFNPPPAPEVYDADLDVGPTAEELGPDAPVHPESAIKPDPPAQVTPLPPAPVVPTGVQGG